MNIHRGRVRHALIILALSLTACGGGGGGGSSTPSLPVVTTPTPTPGPVGAMVSIPVHGIAPSLIAYQAGTSGPWTTVALSGATLSFTLPIGTTAYSVAALCPFNGSGTLRGGGPAQIVIQATTADSPTLWCSPGSLPTASAATINATAFVQANAFPNTDNVSVTQAVPGSLFGSGFTAAGGTDAFGSPLWASGPSDVAIRVFTNATPQITVATRLIRGVSFTPNGTMTFSPLSSITDKATIANVPLQAGSTSGLFFWVPAEGGAINVGFANSSTASLPLIPNATPGDYYYGHSFVLAGGNGVFTQVTTSNGAGFTFPAAPTVGLTITGTQLGDLCSINAPYSGFTVSGKQFYTADLSWPETTQPVANGAPVEHVVASASYLGSSTTVTVPDLSSVAGMMPKPSGGVTVYALGADWAFNGTPVWDNMEGGNILLATMLPNNTQAQSAQSNYFTYTAP